MASLFSHGNDPLNRTELILQEEYFGVSDDELNKCIYGFEEEYDVMDKHSNDNSGKELETTPVVDRTSSEHVIVF